MDSIRLIFGILAMLTVGVQETQITCRNYTTAEVKTSPSGLGYECLDYTPGEKVQAIDPEKGFWDNAMALRQASYRTDLTSEDRMDMINRSHELLKLARGDEQFGYANYRIAHAYYVMGYYDYALRYINHSIASDNREGHQYALLAEISLQTNQLDRAQENAKICLSKPTVDYYLCYHPLVFSLAAQGKYTEAKSALAEFAKLYPDNPKIKVLSEDLNDFLKERGAK